MSKHPNHNYNEDADFMFIRSKQKFGFHNPQRSYKANWKSSSTDALVCHDNLLSCTRTDQVEPVTSKPNWNSLYTTIMIWPHKLCIVISNMTCAMLFLSLYFLQLLLPVPSNVCIYGNVCFCSLEPT